MPPDLLPRQTPSPKALPPTLLLWNMVLTARPSTALPQCTPSHPLLLRGPDTPSLWERDEDDKPGVLSPPRPSDCSPNSGYAVGVNGAGLCYVWEKLPQSRQRKPEVGAVSRCRAVSTPLLFTEKPRSSARDQKRRHLALGAQPWPGPSTSDHFAVCSRAVVWSLWASVWHPLSPFSGI